MKILNLSFQPSTYWPAAPSVDELLSSISGEARRAIVRDDPSRSVEPDDFLIKPTLSEAERRAWGSIHPALMGGEYLPELLEGQVEMPRVLQHMAHGLVDEPAFGDEGGRGGCGSAGLVAGAAAGGVAAGACGLGFFSLRGE